MEEEELYKNLCETKPEGEIALSEKEAEEFEKWLGVR